MSEARTKTEEMVSSAPWPAPANDKQQGQPDGASDGECRLQDTRRDARVLGRGGGEDDRVERDDRDRHPDPGPDEHDLGQHPGRVRAVPVQEGQCGDPGADDDEATHGTDPEVHGGEETGQALRGEQQRDAEGQNRQAAPQRVEAPDVLQVLDEVDEETGEQRGEQQQPREGARQLPVGEDGPGAWASSQCRTRGGTSPGR